MRWLTAGAAELRSSDAAESSRSRILETADTQQRERVLGLLDAHGTDLAHRVTSPGHLTASAVVVDATRTRSLVLMHRKLRRWLQPGGHADGDHELAGVALREATEETGIAGLAVLVPAIRLDVHHVDHGDALGDHLHLDLQFVVSAPSGAVVRGNHESTELRWVTPPELEELVDDRDLVDLVRNGLEVARAAPPPPAG